MYQYLVVGSYTILVGGILYLFKPDTKLDKELIDHALRML